MKNMDKIETVIVSIALAIIGITVIVIGIIKTDWTIKVEDIIPDIGIEEQDEVYAKFIENVYEMYN